MLRLITADLSGAPPTSIARSTGLTIAAVSMAVNKLVKNGIVEKRFLARDKRSVMLYLTELGRQKAIAMENSMVNFVDDVKNRKGRVYP
jgi:DNA-binding MarR family transcriptional regulator